MVILKILVQDNQAGKTYTKVYNTNALRRKNDISARRACGIQNINRMRLTLNNNLPD